MNRHSLHRRVVLGIALFAITAVASAAPVTTSIPVPNGSFDTINSYFSAAYHYSFTTASDAIPGWTNFGGGSKGIVDWYSIGSYDAAFPNTPISATNFRSFFTLGSGGNTAMYTSLGHQVQKGTYTLSLKAGSYLSNTQSPVFNVGFMVDEDPSAGISFNWGAGNSYLTSNNLPAGSWQDLTHEWTVDVTGENIGQDLYIYFTMTSDNVWLSLDDFSVTHTVPEPITAVMLVAGAVVAVRRRKGAVV